MDQPKPPIDLRKNAGSGTQADLERTRLDVTAPASSELEVTRTEIKVDEELKNASSPPTAEKTGITIRLEQVRFFQQVKALFFKRKKKPESKPRLRPSWFDKEKWIGFWVAPPSLSHRRQLLFYLGRAGLVCSGLALTGLLLSSIAQATLGLSWFGYVVWSVGALALGAPLVLVALRGALSWLITLPLAALLALSAVQHLAYRSTGTDFFSVLGSGPAYFYNHLWIIFFLTQLGLILAVYPRPWWAKIPLTLLVAVSLTGFVMNRIYGLPLEASWLGSGILANFPTYRAQPVFIALVLAVPFLFLFTVVYLATPLRKSVALGYPVSNLILLGAAFFLSLVILHKNRVPSLATVVAGTPTLSGLVEIDEKGLPLQVAFTSGKPQGDLTDHAFLKLIPVQGKPDLKLLSVTGQEGFPVFFIKPQELEVTLDSHPVHAVDIKPATPRTLPAPGQNGYILTLDLKAIPLKHEPEHEVAAGGREEALVLTPDEGDYFDSELEVIFQQPHAAQEQGVEATFWVDGKQLASKAQPPYQVILNTSELKPGPHELEVRAGEFHKLLHVVKGPHPHLAFVHPSLGQFINVVAPIELSVSGGELDEVVLFVGEEKIHEWQEGPYTFNWLNHAIAAGQDLILKVRGNARGRVKVSDWVRASTGSGLFQVIPEKLESADEAFFYKKVVVILDASESTRDGWNLRSKWRWQWQLFLDPDILNKLKSSQTGLVVMGSRADRQRRDCHDVDWSFNMGSFDARAVRSGLDKVEPSGTAPLFAAVSRALEAKPDKIILVTDGLDHCTPGLSKKMTQLFENQAALMDVVGLGPLKPRTAETLAEVAHAGHGHFTEVETGENLIRAVSDGLSFRYVLTAGGKTVLEGALGSQDIPLRSGVYRVNLIMNPPFEETDLHIQHGFKTTFKLESAEGKTRAVQETKPLIP